MPDLDALRQQLKEKRQEQADKEQELTQLRGRLRWLDERVRQLRRAGMQDEPDARNPEEERTFQQYRLTIRELETLQSELMATKRGVEALDAYRSAIPSQEAIMLFPDSIPLLLLPVRIETRFMPDLQPHPQLWLRIYPDDIAIESHEPLLTREEFEAGAQYYRDIWPALPDPAPQNWREFHNGAWRRMVDAFDAERSAWVLRVFEDQKLVLNVVSVIDEPRFKVTGSTPLFDVAYESTLESDLDGGTAPASWIPEFAEGGFPLSADDSVRVHVVQLGEQWQISDLVTLQTYRVVRDRDANRLVVSVIDEPRVKIIESTLLFAVAFESVLQDNLDEGTVPASWAPGFAEKGFPLSADDGVQVRVVQAGERWQVSDSATLQTYRVDRDRDANQLIVSVIDGPRFKVTEERLLFAGDLEPDHLEDLDHNETIPATWVDKFHESGFAISENRSVRVVRAGEHWEINDADVLQTYQVVKDGSELVVWVDAVRTRPESWSDAPRSYILPDRFVVRLYRGDSLVYEVEGAPIPHPLIVGPAPFPLEEAENGGNGDDGDDLPETTAAFFDEDCAWIADFDKAVSVGMGLRIDLTHPEDLTGGFGRVVVLGVKASADPDQSVTYLQNLIQSHRYTEGLAFVRQGTPTNNTSEAQAGYSSVGAGADESFEIIHGPPLLAPGETWRDGPRVASALGIAASVFDGILRADGTEDRNAARMLEALWSSTWEYYLDTMMNGVVSADDTEALQQHLFAYVRGRGPYAAIRVGNMPYGILPTFGLKRERPPEDPEAAGRFDCKLTRFLLELYPRWQAMAHDVDAVPRAGGSNDPDKELIGILGMEASGRHVHVRPIITELYLWNLLRFLQPVLFAPGFLWSLLPQGSGTYFQEWWEDFEAALEQSRSVFREFAPDCALPHILTTVPWNPARRFGEPLVTADPLSEEHPLEGLPSEAGEARTNYIRWLKNQPLEAISDDEEARAQSSSLLFQLLRRSILLEERQTQEWLDHLAALPTAELERLLIESLDIASHRLDAWITSLGTKRLEGMRANASGGIQLGAFGWVEDLKPSDQSETELDGGYIHAPSVSHAATAAILRNAYLTHASSQNAEVMSVNLTSERVRHSLWLLEGIREGQELGALLGYRFERGLHERSGGPDGLELDQYIAVFRELYPLKVPTPADEEPEGPAVGEEAVEAVAARNVVDGLKLLEERESIPFGSHGLPPGPSAWPWASPAREYHAIQEVLDSVENGLDALGDLALAESVYQSVLGNYPRAGALLETLGGSGRPPEPEVVETPRSGVNLKHRVIVLFTGDPTRPDLWPQAPRSIAEPHLNAWAAHLLGDNPAEIQCTVRISQTGAAGEDASQQSTLVNLEDLRVGPLDFLYLSRSPAVGEVSELEQRIAYHVRSERQLDEDCRPWVQIVVQLRGKASDGSDGAPAAPPVVDKTSSYSYSGDEGGTFSWAHTVELAVNPVLVVGIALNKNGASVTRVTFGGADLERVDERHMNSVAAELWFLKDPPAGAPKNITVELDQDEQVVAGAVSFVEVDQDEPFVQFEENLPMKTNGATSTSISTSVPSQAGTVLLDVWSKMGMVTGHAAADRQTELWQEATDTGADDSNDEVRGGMSYAVPGEAAYTMLWTSTTTEVRIDYGEASDGVPLAKVMPLARKMLGLISNARTLGPLDLQLPEEAGSLDEREMSEEELERMVAGQLDAYEQLKERLVALVSEDPVGNPGVFDAVKRELERIGLSSDELSQVLVAASYFNVQGAVPISAVEAKLDLVGQAFHTQVESVRRQVQNRHRQCKEALDNATALEADFERDTSKIAEATESLIMAFKFLFGEGFTVLRSFAPDNSDELSLALDAQSTTALLDGENRRWPVLWLQQVARVRPEIRRFESVAMLAEVLSSEDRLALRVAQLPHGSSDRWLALPSKKSGGSEIRQGTLSLVVNTPFQFDAGGAYAGMVLGDWDEIIPGDNETTAVAFHFNRPDAEPPQALLLAVPPESEEDEGVWSWDALVDCVESALDLAKVRAVDLDGLKEFGRFLPAVYSPVRLEENDST